MFAEPMGHEFGRNLMDDCPVAVILANRLRDSRASLSLRWLERTAARVSVAENDIFPSHDLLDHVPLLIEAIADYLASPTEEGPTADQVLAKAAELGQMRFEQGFSPYQILKEFEVLGGIVLSYLARTADEVPIECAPGEFLICAQRVHRSLALIQQATAARYLAMLETHASEREQRLRALNAILSGPLSHRLDEALSAAREMEEAVATFGTALPHDLRARLERVGFAVEQLRMLSRVSPSARMQRNVPLNAAAMEAIRTLRGMARDRDVEIRVPDPLPDMEVNAAAVELAMLVFLTTLLRHAEATGDERWIEVRAFGGGTGVDSVVQVSVKDVGASLPDSARAALDAPRRVDSVADDAAVGVSLEIAREAIEALGGRVTLRSTESPVITTEFILELPSRRAEDLGLTVAPTIDPVPGLN